MENNKENRNYLQTRKVIGLKDYQIEMIEKQAADLGSESSELKADCITEKSQELPGVFLDDFGDARISLCRTADASGHRSGCEDIFTGWMRTGFSIISEALPGCL